VVRFPVTPPKPCKLAANWAKNAALLAKNADATWTKVHWPSAPPLDDPAGELVAQPLEAIALTPEITLADVQAADARGLEPLSPSGLASFPPSSNP
jgi:hypothetical protein